MATLDGDYADGVDRFGSAIREHIFATHPGSFFSYAPDRNLVPPVITIESPTPGIPIASDQAITFTATDDEAVPTAVILAFTMGTGTIPEHAYNGVAWSPGYSGTITVIADGLRFSNVIRSGGWIRFPLTIEAIAIDTSGNIS